MTEKVSCNAVLMRQDQRQFVDADTLTCKGFLNMFDT